VKYIYFSCILIVLDLPTLEGCEVELTLVVEMVYLSADSHPSK